MYKLIISSLINSSFGLALVAGLLGLVRYRGLPPSLRWLALLAGFDALMECASAAFLYILHTTNLFLSPFIITGEVVLLSLAYRQALRSAAFSRVLPWLLGLFSTSALLDSVLQVGVVRYAVSLSIGSDLLMLGLAGLYFRKLLNELHVEQLRRDPFFWVSVALAGYGLGSLLISLCSNYLLTHGSLQLQQIIILGVRNVFNILLYAAYCLAFYLRPSPEPSPAA